MRHGRSERFTFGRGHASVSAGLIDYMRSLDIYQAPDWATRLYPFDLPDLFEHPDYWFRGDVFFAFVEENGELPNTGAGEVPKAFLAEIGERPIRVRVSAVRAWDFLEIMDRFEVLDPATVTDDQRDTRRDLLRETLDRVPLPLIDVIAPSEGLASVWLRPMARTATWVMIVLNVDAPADESLRALIVDPDEAGGEPRATRMSGLTIVPIPIELRLKDIFSLIHLHDADFDHREGGAMPSIAPPPDGPDDDKGDRRKPHVKQELAPSDWDEPKTQTTSYQPPLRAMEM